LAIRRDLFDLESDGTESTDLANRERDRVQASATRFDAWQRLVSDK
jgi:hypothetical protein